MTDPNSVEPTAAYPSFGSPTPDNSGGQSLPPAYPATSGYPAVGQGGYPPAQPNYPSAPVLSPVGMGYPTAARRNGMGTAGLVLGIIGVVLCWNLIGIVLNILAIIFGSVGRARVKRREATNSGAATAGLILGIVGLVLFAGLVALGLSAFHTSVSTSTSGS